MTKPVTGFFAETRIQLLRFLRVCLLQAVCFLPDNIGLTLQTLLQFLHPLVHHTLKRIHLPQLGIKDKEAIRHGQAT